MGVAESQQAIREGMGCEVSLDERVDSVERKDIQSTNYISGTAVGTLRIFIESSCDKLTGSLLLVSSFNR